MDDCAHCGAEYAPTVAMKGGYHAALCTTCRNEWHVYVSGSPLVTQIEDIELEAAMLAAQTAADGINRLAQLRELKARHAVLVANLYGVGEAWVKAGRPA